MGDVVYIVFIYGKGPRMPPEHRDRGDKSCGTYVESAVTTVSLPAGTRGVGSDKEEKE